MHARPDSVMGWSGLTPQLGLRSCPRIRRTKSAMAAVRRRVATAAAAAVVRAAAEARAWAAEVVGAEREEGSMEALLGGVDTT